MQTISILLLLILILMFNFIKISLNSYIFSAFKDPNQCKHQCDHNSNHNTNNSNLVGRVNKKFQNPPNIQLI